MYAKYQSMFKILPRGSKLIAVTSAILLSLIPTTPSYGNNRNNLNSIFFVSKSDNGNQVHYGVQVNPDCSFRTTRPVYPYWKLENGRLEGLLRVEVPAFGIARQSISGNQVVMEINGFRRRGLSKPITIQSSRQGNQNCQILAFANINGENIQLTRVHLDLTKHSFLSGTLHSITFYGTGSKQEKIMCQSNCRF